MTSTALPRPLARLAAALAAVALVTVAPSPAEAVADELSIWVLSVGQGDAALFRGPCGDFGLIDANDGAAGRVLATSTPTAAAAGCGGSRRRTTTPTTSATSRTSAPPRACR